MKAYDKVDEENGFAFNRKVNKKVFKKLLETLEGNDKLQDDEIIILCKKAKAELLSDEWVIDVDEFVKEHKKRANEQNC